MNILENNNHIEVKNYKWENINVSIKDFKEKVEAMLIWGAIWDALWVPIEMKTHDYIKKHYWRVDSYLDSSLNVFFNKWWLASWKKWLTSDDTILTFAWVDSINNKWKIDIENLLKTSINAYNDFPYGFWWATTKAFKKYENAISKWEIIDINKLAEVNTAWNWVIMKQSPYVAYHISQNTINKEIDKDIESLTKLTHIHPTAIVASLVHNRFLAELLKSDKGINFKDLLKYLIKYSEEIEKNILQENNDKISDLLKSLLEDQEKWWLKSYDEILDKYWWWDKQIYSSGYVIITLWIVYSLFLNKQDNETLIDAINIWWDVDTFWAIIWNMLWAYKSKFYSNELENWLPNIDELKTKTKVFIKTILKNNFLEQINKLQLVKEEIFYNSKGNTDAYKLYIRHIWFSENMWYWKIINWKLKLKKDILIADFEKQEINQYKIWEIINIEKLENLD